MRMTCRGPWALPGPAPDDACPFIADGLGGSGCGLNSLSGIASTKPSPRMLSEVRKVARVVAVEDVLLDGGVDRAVVDQRSAGVIGEDAAGGHRPPAAR